MQGEITASSRADPDLRPLVVMCPTRIQPKLLPIELDLSGAFFFEHGFGQAELLQLGPQLQRAWQMVLEALPAEAGSPFSQPQRLLSEYHAERRQSMLGRILSRAKQLRETVDRVVILGPPPLIAAAQAVFAACGHPHHNDLSRGQRGGRPRIYFLPTAPDNDAIQGLLEILPQRKLPSTVDDRWGVLALESNEADRAHHDDGGLLTGLFIVLWDILQASSTAANETELAAFVGPMNSSLMTLAAQIGLPRIGIDHSTPASQFASSAFFHPGVLFAGSVMGIDIVKLLEGAAAMSDRCADSPPGNNPPLDFAGLLHLLSRRHQNHGFRIDSATAALAPLARNLQHPRGIHDLLVQWIPVAIRHDRLSVSMPASATDGDRKKRKDFLLTDIANQQAQTILETRSSAGQYTVVVKIAAVDEASVGQLIQLHALASVIQHYLLKPEL
jgi:hypothetical protein